VTDAVNDDTARTNAPWHLWVIGVLALLWYVSGAITIQLAQLGRLPNVEPGEAAYYAAKPVWLIAVTAVSTYGSVVASLLLLLRRDTAIWTFTVALLAILLSDGAELLSGTSRAYENPAAAFVTALIVVIAAAMLAYSRAMQRHWALR
jgi:hypothetical protein